MDNLKAVNTKLLTHRPLNCLPDKILPAQSGIKYRKLRGDHEGQLYIFANGRPLYRSFLASTIKYYVTALRYDDSQFNTHSFRMGKATDMSADGYTDRQNSYIW